MLGVPSWHVFILHVAGQIRSSVTCEFWGGWFLPARWWSPGLCQRQVWFRSRCPHELSERKAGTAEETWHSHVFCWGEIGRTNKRGWGAEEERLSIFLYISLNATRQKGKVIVTGHSDVFSQSRVRMIVVQRLFCLVFSCWSAVESSQVYEASPKPIERNTYGHKGKSKS